MVGYLRMRGKGIALTAVLAAGLLVAGCGQAPSPKSAASPTSTAAKTSVPATVVRVMLREQGYPELASASDQAYNEVGRSICEAAAELSPIDEADAEALAGLTADTLARATGRQYGLEDGATIVGIFIGAYCPSELPGEGS